jgi:hypothetical protein
LKNIELIKEKVKFLRKKVLEYRLSEEGNYISTHVNAVEIAVCLIEICLDSNPPRAIKKEEECWFRAGYHLSYIFPIGGEFDEISQTYDALVDEVEKSNFFR